MMNDDSTSGEFARIEAMLRDGGPGEPPAALRASVMRAVNEQLIAARPEFAAQGTGWGFLIGIAAMLLIGANLAVISGADTRLAPRVRIDSVQATTAARVLQDMAPELSADEARQMVVLAACGRELTPVPQIEPHVGPLAPVTAN